MHWLILDLLPFLIFYFFPSDVDECTEGVYPCQNGATCKNIFGNYECDCTEGWMDKDCDKGYYMGLNGKNPVFWVRCGT